MIEILKNTHDDKNRISLNFALAKAMEDSGLYEQDDRDFKKFFFVSH